MTPPRAQVSTLFPTGHHHFIDTRLPPRNIGLACTGARAVARNLGNVLEGRTAILFFFIAYFLKPWHPHTDFYERTSDLANLKNNTLCGQPMLWLHCRASFRPI